MKKNQKFHPVGETKKVNKMIRQKVKYFNLGSLKKTKVTASIGLILIMSFAREIGLIDELEKRFSHLKKRKKALEYFKHFKEHWEKELPSAIKCLVRSIERCLAFFYFPQEEWICLRTTNVIERLNKEFKRRTKPMEIVAGERACYTLLTFICLKMELHWRTYPMGKRVSNLPALQNLQQINFTQST